MTLRGIVPVTTPARTALHVASKAGFETGVVVLDSALRSRQTNLSELNRVFTAAQGPGVVGARTALASADPASGSVPESEARLLFARAGLPAPVTQFVVHTAAGLEVRLDFAWEEAMLAAEIDGFRYHSASGDFQRDRTKQNAVQLAGWLVLRFTVRDLHEWPDQVVAEIWHGLTRLGRA